MSTSSLEKTKKNLQNLKKKLSISKDLVEKTVNLD